MKYCWLTAPGYNALPHPRPSASPTKSGDSTDKDLQNRGQYEKERGRRACDVGWMAPRLINPLDDIILLATRARSISTGIVIAAPPAKTLASIAPMMTAGLGFPPPAWREVVVELFGRCESTRHDSLGRNRAQWERGGSRRRGMDPPTATGSTTCDVGWMVTPHRCPEATP